ncbi:Helix-loop-helix DNA-binding domain protein [Ostertagia ostertagi]
MNSLYFVYFRACTSRPRHPLPTHRRQPDFSGDRKMKKPMMEKLRRKRINDSLLYLKEFLLNVSPQQSSPQLDQADILEWTVRYLEEQRGNVTAVGDQAAVYRSGREEGFARGFAHASQAVFNYLQMAMPHDFQPTSTTISSWIGPSFEVSCAAMPSRSGATTQPIAADPPKWSPGTPPASDISSSESPEPTGSPGRATRPKETRGERRPHLTREDDSCREPPSKKVWQPWQ